MGNIDDSVTTGRNSYSSDLFKPSIAYSTWRSSTGSTFWVGIPKNKDENLARRYGLIIEYLAEAFHHLARQTNRFAYAKSHCKLGKGYDQRDQTAVLKSVCAFLKILHPGVDPTPAELDEYLEYAVEGRRRVKEQLNKRKDDDEFAHINLSFVRSTGEEVVAYCPESKDSQATQHPLRGPAREEAIKAAGETVAGPSKRAGRPTSATVATPALPQAVGAEQPVPLGPKERHYRIHYGAIGYSYDTIFGDYFAGADEITVEDPYIRAHHQIVNFLRFCETAVRTAKPKKIQLITKFDSDPERDDAMAKLFTVADSLKQHDVQLEIKQNDRIHDREIRFSNGWIVKIGRGFDIYQKPDDWLSVGANDLDLRPCLETSVDIFPAA